MTEQEAIKVLDRTKYIAGLPDQGSTWKANAETIALDMAISALEEIQKYREIGTVDRFWQLSQQFAPHVTGPDSCQMRMCNKCDKYRRENEKYHAVGTVEECREARERQKANKPNLYGDPEDGKLL